MKTKMAEKEFDRVAFQKEVVESLARLSRDPKVTSNPDWPNIKKGLEQAAKGQFSEWKDSFR